MDLEDLPATFEAQTYHDLAAEMFPTSRCIRDPFSSDPNSVGSQIALAISER